VFCACDVKYFDRFDKFCQV